MCFLFCIWNKCASMLWISFSDVGCVPHSNLCKYLLFLYNKAHHIGNNLRTTSYNALRHVYLWCIQVDSANTTHRVNIYVVTIGPYLKLHHKYFYHLSNYNPQSKYLLMWARLKNLKVFETKKRLEMIIKWIWKHLL